MEMSRKTASGMICPSDVWCTYIKNLLDRDNARDMLKGVLMKNASNPDAIKELKQVLFHRPDLLEFIDKISALL